MRAFSVTVGASEPTDEVDMFQFLDSTHQQIDLQLLRLTLLVERLEHRPLTPDETRQGSELIGFFRNDARIHHQDEERHVLPSLLSSPIPATADVARKLQQDHQWLEQLWLAIDPCIDAAVMGSRWFDQQELTHAVGLYTDLYADHMVLEETVAYPQAHQHLSAQLLQGASRDLSRRWTLHQRTATRAAHKDKGILR
ncbi:MAG TPA: hemerythrin domain-containing protein [Burkholderiaceae bacterium]|nr:hemerythrin domain-containing protein [Burkholderiaceae bacterium]